ncbi:TspO and MBR related proteins [Streptomyces sp. 1222.5]|uniref:TspO/MBR family protein n=1 Tax=unclassified Streptomyces TaxID=2593676 RepID=UPI0008953186|nr:MULTISPECIES: TspO/MBR family protein [unclassified Streptomyces]PKW05464.1 TspO/MBR related protein [Streptomyces sp. 5112.2]SEC17035.1 TspO and MBR related proteins [Streptomyces sp. 2231.1]SED38728.1 TspO and MBR related proteins [Streptomyces sp. 1222.5]
MRLIRRHGGNRRWTGSWPCFAATGAAVAAAAATSARAVDADGDWYRSLRKPLWEPPPRAFGAVWTPLYATIAYAGGRALDTASHRRERGLLAASLAVNLTLNAGWSRLFFGLRSTRAGLLGTVLLDVSNVELIRRVARTDRTAAAALLPYAAWSAFATALNASIVRQN